MAQADITLSDGSKIKGIEVPDWLAPHVTEYLEALSGVKAAAAEMAIAAAAHGAAEQVLLQKQQEYAAAQQALENITASIAQDIEEN